MDVFSQINPMSTPIVQISNHVHKSPQIQCNATMLLVAIPIQTLNACGI